MAWSRMRPSPKGACPKPKLARKLTETHRMGWAAPHRRFPNRHLGPQHQGLGLRLGRMDVYDLLLF